MNTTKPKTKIKPYNMAKEFFISLIRKNKNNYGTDSVDITEVYKKPTIPMNAVVEINGMVSNSFLTSAKFGLEKMSIRYYPYQDLYHRYLTEAKDAFVKIDITSIANISSRTRHISINHVFYILGKDNNVYEIKLATYCAVNSDAFEEEMAINVCRVFAKGILKTMKLDYLTDMKLSVPDSYSDLIKHGKSNYVGSSTVYMNDTNDEIPLFHMEDETDEDIEKYILKPVTK